VILNSYAKLNLYLSVRNKRKDSYHNLTTIFERISLADRIILKLRKDGQIKMSCSDKGLACDSSNLVLRAAKLLQESCRVKKGVQIRLIKRIPIGAGLGGGSSNAAYTLMGLNKLWKLNLTRGKLAALALRLGSDVPFFIYDCPFALGEGRGEKIKPIKEAGKLRLWHILAVPRIRVSTPLIYKKWDESLTRPGYDVKIILPALKKRGIFSLTQALFNSLEPVTKQLYPEVKRIKDKLLKSGVRLSLMSGSGSAVFGIVATRKEAARLARQFKREKASWRVFCSRTV
jgi:4-diphosphocytidyl-2-C-methyl-D-erythritol kinase